MDESKKIMTMISYAGSAKTKLITAMRETSKRNYKKAYQLIEEADKDLEACHQAQTNILFKDCDTSDVNDFKNNISVLLIHAMDQVMDAMNMRDIVYEMINLVRSIQND